MNFDGWVKSLPDEIKADSLKVEAYRLALFAWDIAWADITVLRQDPRTLDLSAQLFRAIGSISANKDEEYSKNYSKNTGKDRARFYEYALGSARESRDWYWKAHFVLKEEIVQHRISLLTQIIRPLLTMVPRQRSNPTGIREEQAPYLAHNHDYLDHIPQP